MFSLQFIHFFAVTLHAENRNYHKHYNKRIMKRDDLIFDIIEKEHQRQLKGIELKLM